MPVISHVNLLFLLVLVGFITSLKNRFIEFAKPFDVSRSPSASEKCRKDTKAFIKGLDNLDFWALRSKFIWFFVKLFSEDFFEEAIIRQTLL